MFSFKILGNTGIFLSDIGSMLNLSLDCLVILQVFFRLEGLLQDNLKTCQRELKLFSIGKDFHVIGQSFWKSSPFGLATTICHANLNRGGLISLLHKELIFS